MKVTVITPTYNRSENLQKLYKSLKKQTNKEFIWLVIDDGSTDDTEKVMNEFISKKELAIEYYKKQNGGKHTALNMGREKIQTELTFIVDSDDWLEDNAIERINIYHEKYKINEEICGYSFLRKYSNGTINGKKFDKNEIIDDYINVRINGKDTNADKAEVWKTKYLKEYPFPEFQGEKFLGEDVVWMQLALKYKMVFINEPIYISEYLDNGLTKNRRKNNIKSPNGCYYRSKLVIDISKEKKINFKYLQKNIVQFIVYGKLANKSFKEMYKTCVKKNAFIFFYCISLIIYKIWTFDRKTKRYSKEEF